MDVFLEPRANCPVAGAAASAAALEGVGGATRPSAFSFSARRVINLAGRRNRRNLPCRLREAMSPSSRMWRKKRQSLTSMSPTAPSPRRRRRASSRREVAWSGDRQRACEGFEDERRRASCGGKVSGSRTPAVARACDKIRPLPPQMQGLPMDSGDNRERHRRIAEKPAADAVVERLAGGADRGAASGPRRRGNSHRMACSSSAGSGSDSYRRRQKANMEGLRAFQQESGPIGRLSHGGPIAMCLAERIVDLAQYGAQRAERSRQNQKLTD